MQDTDTQKYKPEYKSIAALYIILSALGIILGIMQFIWDLSDLQCAVLISLPGAVLMGISIALCMKKRWAFIAIIIITVLIVLLAVFGTFYAFIISHYDTKFTRVMPLLIWLILYSYAIICTLAQDYRILFPRKPQKIIGIDLLPKNRGK